MQTNTCLHALHILSHAILHLRLIVTSDLPSSITFRDVTIYCLMNDMHSVN